MAIEIRYARGQCCPIIICDFCGEQIVNAKEGNYEWLIGTGGPVCFTHKRCCRAFENAHGGCSLWGTNELQTLPFYLCNNLELKWETAQELGIRLALI